MPDPFNAVHAGLHKVVDNPHHNKQILEQSSTWTGKQQGRLVHHSNENKPIHFISGYFTKGEQVVGLFKTDENGNIQGNVDPAYVNSKLTLKVLYPAKELHRDSEPNSQTKMRVIYEEKVRSSTAGVFNIGNKSIEMCEWHDHFPLYKWPSISGAYPHQLPTEGYIKHTAQHLPLGQLVASKIGTLFGDFKFLGDPLAHIQSKFPANLTMRLEQQTPGITRTGIYLGDRILNGFHRPSMEKIDENSFRISVNWDKEEFDNDYYLPNVVAVLEKRVIDEKSTLVVTQVSLQYRKLTVDKQLPLPPVKTPNDLHPTVTFKQGDAYFQDALTDMRMSLASAGQMDEHLFIHIKEGIFANAAESNFVLEDGPMRKLMGFPNGLAVINTAGDGLIFNETGVIAKGSALTGKSVEARLGDNLARIDWKNFRKQLPEPVCDNDRRARWQLAFYDFVHEFVGGYFDKVAADKFKFIDDQGRYPYWIEAQRFAEEVVAQYARVHGKLTPIITSSIPTDEEINNLKEVWAMMIYEMTLGHSQTHNMTLDDMGELKHAPLGRLSMAFGVEAANFLRMHAKDGANQLQVANTLNDLNHGRFMENEYDDIDKDWRNSLESRRGFFAALGLDIDTIRSRINT